MASSFIPINLSTSLPSPFPPTLAKRSRKLSRFWCVPVYSTVTVGPQPTPTRADEQKKLAPAGYSLYKA